MNEKEKAKLKMEEALKHLREAWSECNDAFSNIYINCNDYILGDEENGDTYPFHMSFDEMNVVNWIDGALERLDNKEET